MLDAELDSAMGVSKVTSSYLATYVALEEMWRLEEGALNP